MNSQNKIKSAWNIINQVVGDNRPDCELELQYNNAIITDPEKVASLFQSHFKHSPTNKSSGNSLSNTPAEARTKTLFLIPTCHIEVKNIILSLPPKYSTGLDDVSTIPVKAVANIICYPLAEIINECLGKGIFPELLKLTKIVPVYKKGRKEEIDNYRPVALISVFGKIVERIIYDRLLKYFLANDIFVTNHHGFLPNKSTQTAIYESLNFLISQIDRGKQVAGLYFDFSKAFKSVNHEILLKKLELYGVRGIANALIKSYLKNREQKVCITTTRSGKRENVYSNGVEINVGIPQGSILGPILFLIFVNDLTYNVNINSLYQFADDTSAIITETNIPLLSQHSTAVAREVQNWCTNNDLVLNVKKTALINYRNRYNESLYVNLAGKSIEEVRITKFLGIILDRDLRWIDQIETVIKRLNSACYAMKCLKDQLSLPTLKMFYFAYVQSIIQYSIIFWYHSVDTNKIFTYQKRVIRTMLNLPYNTSCKQYFIQLKIMTVPCIYIFNIAVYVKKNLQSFLTNSDNYKSMTTRGRNDLSIPLHRTTLFQKSPFYNCIKVYNALPDHIKKKKSLLSYKYEVKKYLLDKAYYALNEYYCDT